MEFFYFGFSTLVNLSVFIIESSVIKGWGNSTVISAVLGVSFVKLLAWYWYHKYIFTGRFNGKRGHLLSSRGVILYLCDSEPLWLVSLTMY